MSRDMNIECKVYIGDLPRDVSEKEIEREFEQFGRLKKVWVARNPPGFAFVEFEDPRDADDSIRALDGQHRFGNRIRVEPSTGKRRTKPWERGPPRGGPPSRSYSSRGPPRYDPYRSGGADGYDRDRRYPRDMGGYDRPRYDRGRSRSPIRKRRSYSRSRSGSPRPRGSPRSPPPARRYSRSPSRE